MQWAKKHADAAQKARKAAEAKAAQAEAAAEAAKEAAQNVAAEAERKLADTHGLIDSLRAELLNSEVARAEGATRSREKMDQLSARLSEGREPIIVGVLRNGKGLLEGIDFQFGSERVRVGAIRNAAGKIVEMRRR